MATVLFTDYITGHILGKEYEDSFTSKAKAHGLSDEEAKSAFNRNMLESGVLTDGPAEFGRTHKRRWLVSDYEAGDVVLPYFVHGEHTMIVARPLRCQGTHYGPDRSMHRPSTKILII